MKNKIIYVTTIVAIALLPSALLAQKVSEKCVYFFERLENKAPWIVSDNAAGLVYNNALNFSNVGAYYGSENGDYRNFNQAEKYQNFGAITKSYVKTNKVFFYGSFNYDYGIKQNQAWLGTIYEDATFNPILDSIPGKVLREDYILSAKVGYAASKQFSMGVAFDYHTASAAKRVDGRNANTLSMFSVSPGVTYNRKLFTAGLNLTYKHDVERVSYDFIGDITGKRIYNMEGLFMNSFAGITNTTILDRGYFKNIFGGAAQLELRKGNLKFFNQFKVGYNKENDFEGNSLTKRYAFVEGLRYDYNGLITFISKKMDHNLYINFVSDEQFGYAVINNYELIPGEVSSWAYFEYGKTLRYIQTGQKYGLEYKGYVRRGGAMSYSLIATLGANYITVEKDYKIFPAKYHQDYSNTELYARLDKNIKVKNTGMIDINIGGSYTDGAGTMLTERNPLTTGSLMQNSSLLEHDFAYRTADRAKIGGGIKYSHFINPEKGTTVYGGVNYSHQYLIKDGNLSSVLNGVLPGTFRSLLSVNIGLNF